MLRKFFNLNFGIISVEEIFKAVFILGLIPGIIISFINTFGKSNWSIYSFDSIGIIVDLFVYLVIFAFFALLYVAVWKIVCELSFLIFKALKVYIHKKD